MMRNVWRYTLGLLTAAVVGLSGTAQATFSISISSPSFVGMGSINDSTGTNSLVGGPTTINITGGGFFATSYSLQAIDTASTAAIQTTGTGVSLGNISQSSITVTVTITKDDFTGATDPGSVFFFSNSSVTAANTGTSFGQLMASVNPNPAALSFGPTALSLTPTSFSGNTAFSRGMGNLTISETYTFTMAPLENITIVIGSIVGVGPVSTPVPATALAAIAALPVLGLGLRRRTKSVVA